VITVELYADTVCPWCRIGKRNLERALKQWPGEPVEVIHRAFSLNPSIPGDGYDFRDYMIAKGRGRIGLDEWFAGPRRAGAAAGLHFNFEHIERAPNSTLSHQLIALAHEALRSRLVDALYTAYFEDGRDIGDIETLVAIAAEQGLEREEVRAQLAAGAGREQVAAEARRAQELGIGGVPFFIFDGRFGLSGAQPPEVLLQALTYTVDQRAAEVEET
jgi:predicted DsbA family dithiol-disulfide isomerase